MKPTERPGEWRREWRRARFRGPSRGRAGVSVLSAAVALLLLAGCGDITPGTASVVNGTRITNDDVEELTSAQCVLRKQLTKTQQAPAASASRVRQESLWLLMDTELSKQFGESEGIEVDKGLAGALFGQVEPFFEPLPEKSRTVFNEVFENWAEGRAVLVQAGGEATGQLPRPENLEQVMNAGLVAREKWQQKADIKTDPSFAPGKDGFPGGESSSSVSRAISDFAKKSAAAEQDPDWISALPASQRCG